MAGIFNIDWNNVAENLTPHFWRKTSTDNEGSLVSYIKCIYAPIQTLGTTLNDYNDEIIDFLNYTGQHLSLEEYLNDVYDITLRRITITENDIGGIDPIVIGLTSDTISNPVEIGLSDDSVTVPLTISLSGEAIISNNFTINMPTSIVYNVNVLEAQMRNYIEASMNYNVQTF